MSQSIMNAVNQKYPDLLRANTHQTDTHFCYRACEALGPTWRLLGKASHENGYTWPNGVRTSHDAICQVDGNGNKIQVVDVVVGAGSGAPTGPSWGTIPPEHWRASNTPVELGQVPAPGGAGPSPDPDPRPDPKPKPPAASVPSYESIGGDQFFWHEFGSILESDYQGAGQTLNAGSSVWFARTIYDTLRDLVTKGGDPRETLVRNRDAHRKTWRQILGYRD
jgi:hypothetical protein